MPCQTSRGVKMGEMRSGARPAVGSVARRGCSFGMGRKWV